MKINHHLTRCGLGCLVLSLLLIGVELGAQEDKSAAKLPENLRSPETIPDSGRGVKVAMASTQRDEPGKFHQEFGMLPGSKLARKLRPLSKIDMDGDLNYDGEIDNNSSVDQSFHEYHPPGLQIGEGELTKLIIRFKTYEIEFPGDLYVTLDVSGVNRYAASGDYASDDQEKAATGRIRVWRDAQQSELLIDSHDPEKKRFEWKVDKAALKSGIPGDLPRTIFVEGVEASKLFEGDLRLLVSSAHSLSETEPRQPSAHYKTAFDHILITIREEPVKKELINEGAVWSKAKKG